MKPIVALAVIVGLGYAGYTLGCWYIDWDLELGSTVGAAVGVSLGLVMWFVTRPHS